jgi:2-polyprenyl-3-methyl-5-hydroxy-6-metoxy-1,4-benzoquinol methylase
MSVVFKWKEDEFEALLRSCSASADTPTPYILGYMPKDGVVLEAGCGMGRYVVYMSELGFHIQGLEIGRDAIRVAKRHRPETKV